MGYTTQIAAQTVQAYRETEYRVGGDAPFVLTVGCTSPDLLREYARQGVQSCAFITACNPYSFPLSEADNAQRDRNLTLLLQGQGFSSQAGLGQHPSNGWPGEPSQLVWGVARDKACHIANQFQQNAFVWAAEDGVPELILLR
jgi:Protein of unknown function (DUF3293)